MMLEFTSMDQIDPRKLMNIYSEGNLENTDYFYPEIEDKNLAVKKVELDFLKYIEDHFFNKDQNKYLILEKDGFWVCALRLYHIKKNLYYIEALETRPEFRKKGYALELLSCVIEALKAKGSFQLFDCVSKKNIASIKTHEKAGFTILSEEGFDYLSETSDDRDYGMGFEYNSLVDRL